MKVVDLAGCRFGRLVAVGPAAERTKSGAVRWLCRCDCGADVAVPSFDLKSGNTASCGCGRGKRPRHGHARKGGATKEYRTWTGMIGRCTDPGVTGFARYGGRGIAVCDRWRASFEAFLADMGPKPSPAHSIDRIDNDGNYEPGNCRWATRVQQARNKTTTRWVRVDGREVSLAEAAETAGITASCLSSRLSAGAPASLAVLPDAIRPRRRRCRPCGTKSRWPLVEYNGVSMSLKDWAREAGMPYGRLIHRLQKGWTMDEAIDATRVSRFTKEEISAKCSEAKLKDWAARKARAA